MSITVYGIPNCDVIKKALKWLNQNNLEYTFHDYKKQSIDKNTLQNWFSQKQIIEVINLRSTTWKELQEQDKEKIDNENEIINIIQQNTSIIKRPIITNNNKIILIGFDTSTYSNYFKKLPD